MRPGDLILAAMPLLAWHVPNHYPPWPAAWGDGLTLFLLFVSLLLCARETRVPRLITAAAALAALSVFVQWASHTILFGGDALMALIYLAALVIAVALGNELGRQARSPVPGIGSLDVWALGLVFAALASTGFAAAQWTGAVSLGLWGVELAPGARPYGNVAQPNNLCTILFVGLCALSLLREARRIGPWVWAMAVLFLVFGMTMTGSRTGWLQMGCCVVLLALTGHQARSILGWKSVAAIAAGYASFVVLWPALNAALLLSGGRGVLVQIDGGVRLPFWTAMVVAIREQPLWGYGWQQVVLAQEAVALQTPAVRRHFEHSHNLVLDLLLWAGVPVGGAVLALGGVALFRQLRAVLDARAVWLMAAVVGVVAHAMVEFPLEYAYILVPTGIAWGAAYGLTWPEGGLCWPLGLQRLVAACALVLLGATAGEYLRAEQSYREMRFESSRIGSAQPASQTPRLLLLTQLEALLAFGRSQPRAGMSEQAVDEMRRVAARFAYPSSMLRYAVALGLNGQPDAALRQLGTLCQMHPAARCDEAQLAWESLRQRHTGLPAFAKTALAEPGGPSERKTRVP